MFELKKTCISIIFGKKKDYFEAKLFLEKKNRTNYVSGNSFRSLSISKLSIN